jgi:hypothetical protein
MAKWLGAIGRYLVAPPLAGILAFLAMRALAARSDDFETLAPIVAYGVASVTWVVFAVLERQRLLWRLLLTCS